MDRSQTRLIRVDKLRTTLWETVSTMAFRAVSDGATVTAVLLLYLHYGGALVLSLLLISIVGFVYHSEDHLWFDPDMPDNSRIFVRPPSMFGLPYESIFIKSLDGVRVHLFLIKQPGHTSKIVPTILWMHGSAGNMGHNLENMVGFYNKLKCNIVALEYRGYGYSQGSPSEKGFYMDASAAIDYILTRSDLNHERVIVYGHSLGGAVAIDIATRVEYSRHIWCVIVENTFTSIPDMVTTKCNILKYLPLFVHKNKFMSNCKMEKLQVPILFVSGVNDIIVPPVMTNNLFDACCSPLKGKITIIGGSHNTTWNCPDYYECIKTFIKINKT